MDLSKSICQNLEHVQQRIDVAMKQAQRSDAVKLVAVSKLQPAEAILCAINCGQFDFGENYVQEALVKQDLLQKNKDLHWHFTGHIQSRKAKDIVGRFDLIHTVSSEKLAHIINKLAAEKNIQQSVLIQVNVGNEEQKSGVHQDDLFALAEIILQCKNLNLQGLMCLPPVFDAGLAARPHFAFLRSLRDNIAEKFNCSLPHLSMGMSGDLEAAIYEGATIIRIGTDIFGNR